MQLPAPFARFGFLEEPAEFISMPAEKPPALYDFFFFELFVPKNSNRLAAELARGALTRIFKGKGGGNKQRRKKEGDLWRTEVKTLKKKRQMEENQTAPCESEKPLSDGAVCCIDTITERRPEPANTP